MWGSIMKCYAVTLSYRTDGSGSGMTVTVYANNEFHACNMAQSNYPGMFAVYAKLY